VIFKIPVDKPESSVPLRPTTVVVPPVLVLVASPVKATKDPDPPVATQPESEQTYVAPVD
jgi:hypothetical protein